MLSFSIPIGLEDLGELTSPLLDLNILIALVILDGAYDRRLDSIPVDARVEPNGQLTQSGERPHGDDLGPFLLWILVMLEHFQVHGYDLLACDHHGRPVCVLAGAIDKHLSKLTN